LKFSGDVGGAFLEVHTEIKIAPKKIILRRGEIRTHERLARLLKFYYAKAACIF
jgi:hypothetical protein